jgi:hypothetical protein
MRKFCCKNCRVEGNREAVAEVMLQGSLMAQVSTAGGQVYCRTSHVSSVVYDDGRKEAKTTLTKGSSTQVPL